jgi:hypothetical protein
MEYLFIKGVIGLVFFVSFFDSLVFLVVFASIPMTRLKKIAGLGGAIVLMVTSATAAEAVTVIGPEKIYEEGPDGELVEVDDVKAGEEPASVPEPVSLMGLVAVGGVGALMRRTLASSTDA